MILQNKNDNIMMKKIISMSIISFLFGCKTSNLKPNEFYQGQIEAEINENIVIDKVTKESDNHTGKKYILAKACLKDLPNLTFDSYFEPEKHLFSHSTYTQDAYNYHFENDLENKLADLYDKKLFKGQFFVEGEIISKLSKTNFPQIIKEGKSSSVMIYLHLFEDIKEDTSVYINKIVKLVNDYTAAGIDKVDVDVIWFNPIFFKEIDTDSLIPSFNSTSNQSMSVKYKDEMLASLNFSNEKGEINQEDLLEILNYSPNPYIRKPNYIK